MYMKHENKKELRTHLHTKSSLLRVSNIKQSYYFKNAVVTKRTTRVTSINRLQIQSNNNGIQKWEPNGVWIQHICKVDFPKSGDEKKNIKK